MSKESHFSIRLPILMQQDLDRLARETRRSRNQVIELLLETGIKKALDDLKLSRPVRRLLP